MVEKTENIDNKSEGLEISGFTLGIIAIVFSGLVGIILSIIGFTLCMIQQKRKKNKLSKSGLILNVIAFVLGILLIILYSYIAPLLNQLPLN